jgi:hypothetical protein
MGLTVAGGLTLWHHNLIVVVRTPGTSTRGQRDEQGIGGRGLGRQVRITAFISVYKRAPQERVLSKEDCISLIPTVPPIH